jgi:hypothetical protein
MWKSLLCREMYYPFVFLYLFFIIIPKSLSEKRYDLGNFHNRQHPQTERILGYFRPIVTFQHALLTFWIGSY